MSKFQFSTIVVLLLVVIAAVTAPLVWRPKPKEQRWEFQVHAFDDRDLIEKLDNMGSQGWDVVSARRASEGSSGSYEFVFRHLAP